MRRVILAILALALALSTTASSELLGREIGAVATSQTFTINASTLLVINDGANEIYVRVFWEGETSADAVANASTPQIKSGEGFTYSKTFNVAAISIICASGETATVRLQYW